MSTFTNVSKFTRTGKYGKEIFCPNCKLKNKIFDFNWTSRPCSHCQQNIRKYEWLIKIKTSKLIGQAFKIGDKVIKKPSTPIIPKLHNKKYSYGMNGVVLEAFQKVNSVGKKNWYYKVKFENSNNTDTIPQFRLTKYSNEIV